MRKILLPLFAVIIILAALVFIDRAPQPRLSPEQLKMEIDGAYQAHLRWQVVWWALTVGLALAMFGGGAFVIVLAKNKRERVYADPVTGMWPIMRENKSPLWRRIAGVHDWVIEDPNLASAPTRRVYANGTLQVTADTHGVPIERQLEYAAQSWTVQRTIASGQQGFRPNQAMLKAVAGVYEAEAGRKQAQAQLVQNRLLSAQPPVPSEPFAQLTTEQALDKSADGVVYIGQQDFDIRAYATWSANSASTLGIFGANGTGKTSSVAAMVTLAMLRWGWQLYILDGKDSGDWDEFGTHAEVLQVDGQNVEQVIEHIWQQYQVRRRLMAEHRARKYMELPADVRSEYPQWGMVFEEFGGVRMRLRNRQRAALDKFIDILCKEARYTGWHGVFIDQRPSDYTNDMKGNLKSIACFKLLMNQGHAVNCYQAGNLANVGEFEMDGERYKAFYAQPMARSVLAGLPVRSSVRSFVRSVPPPALPNEAPPAPNERTPNGSTELQSLVWLWRDTHPEGTQAQMRSDFVKDGIEITRSYAHELWHKYEARENA